jgi:hypothetical protein
LTDEADLAAYPHSDNITLVGLRWLASSTPSPVPDATTTAGDRASDAGSPPTDPVQKAIAEIHRAMLAYAGEMKNNR